MLKIHEYKSAIEKKYLKGTLKWIKTHNRIGDNENFADENVWKEKETNKRIKKNKDKRKVTSETIKKTRKKWRWIGKNERWELRHILFKNRNKISIKSSHNI